MWTSTAALTMSAFMTLLCSSCATPQRAASSAQSETEAGVETGPVPSESSPPVLASASESWLEAPRTVALEVAGFLPAVMVVPAGDDVRPLVAAAHGAGGAPEWECEYWQRLTSGRAFVLCLRGTAMGGGSFYFKHHYALRDELVAATRAARAAFPRIAPSSGVYAGFSQGASMGSLVVAHLGAQFSYSVLVEGFEQWNIPLGRSFARGGGKGVLFVCGTASCAGKAERSAQAIEKAGIKARASYAVGAGHTPLGGVLPLVERDLPWLLAGDPLWQ